MFDKYTLDNGITVVTENMSNVRSVSFGVFVRNGSRYECAENNGISHFIEHMLFKGTEKRSAKDIAGEMDAIGGQLNAYTTKEYTCYYARVLDSHFDIAFDIISDMFFNSKFDDNDIEREAGVIFEEISMYEDAPDDVVFDRLQHNIWRGNPLGMPVLGTRENISKFNGDFLRNYFNKNYCSDDTVIAIAGNFDKQKVKERIEEYFASFSRKTDRKPVLEPQYNKSFVKIEKDIEQIHLVGAFNSLKLDDDASYAMSVLNTVFGGGMSSRLFQRIREQNGLAYTVCSFSTAYTDTGLFNIYAGMKPAQLNRVYSLISDEIKRIKNEKLKAEDIAKTKEQIKSSYMLSLESTSSRMSSIGRLMVLLNKFLTPEELLQKVDAVDAELVNSLIEKVFDMDNISLCIVGRNMESIEI